MTCGQLDSSDYTEASDMWRISTVQWDRGQCHVDIRQFRYTEASDMWRISKYSGTEASVMWTLDSSDPQRPVTCGELVSTV